MPRPPRRFDKPGEQRTMGLKPKLALEVPEPPPITEELRRWLLAEAKVGREEMARKVVAIERLTPDDLRVRVR